MRRVGFWLALLCVGVGGAGPSWAAPPRVAVFPPEIYNAPELEPLGPGLQAMLASRLAGEGYTVSTAPAGEPGDAAWVLRTTITHLGQVFSVDTALEPLTGGIGTRSYETVGSRDELVAALDKLARHLRAELERGVGSGPAPPAAGAPPPTPPASAAAPGGAAPAPEATAPTVAGPAPAPETTAPAEEPRDVTAALERALTKHRVSPVLDGEARSLVVTDADGDGANEILILLDGEIVAFRDRGSDIARVWASAVPTGFDTKVLSAGDVDGNGIPEVFVAGLQGTQPTTQALEWFGSALTPKGSRVNAFLRARSHPARGVVLLGLASGPGKDLFGSRTLTFAWDRGAYREAGTSNLPTSAVPINAGWFRLEPGRPPFTVVTTQGDRLEIFDPDGERVFRSEETVKGSRIFLQGEERVRDYQDEDFYRVQGKTVALEVPGAATHLVIYRNYGALGRIFQRVANFSHGQVQVWRWDGLTLIEVAKGPKLPGFITDQDLGPSVRRPGTSTLYAALAEVEGTLFRAVKTRIVAYDLPAVGSGPAAAASP